MSTFNARAETAGHSPVFREAYRSRRALVPIQGAYEWDGEKGNRLPLAITRTDGKPLVCAALWNELGGVTSCTIPTRRTLLANSGRGVWSHHFSRLGSDKSPSGEAILEFVNRVD